MKLTIRIKDDLPKRFYPVMDEAMRLAVLYHAEELTNQVKWNIQGPILRKQTGGLTTAWSVQPKVTKDRDGWKASLNINSPYAAIHEGPENGEMFTEIVPNVMKNPRPNPHLRFVINGKEVYVKSVRIPARRYVSRSFDTVRAQSAKLTRMAISDAGAKFKGFGGGD